MLVLAPFVTHPVDEAKKLKKVVKVVKVVGEMARGVVCEVASVAWAEEEYARRGG